MMTRKAREGRVSSSSRKENGEEGGRGWPYLDSLDLLLSSEQFPSKVMGLVDDVLL
jgi:hypothetical protein